MSEEKEKKKKSKKGLIIALLLIIVIIAVAVVVVVLMNGSSEEEKTEEEKTTGVEWGDSYYVYLLEDFEEEVSEELGIEKIEEIEIAFVELEDFDYPVMLIEGLIEDEEMFAVAYVEDKEVKTSEYMYLSEYEYSDVSYLYNIENEEYDWYVHTIDDEYDCYKTLSDYVSGENESYVEFEKDETSDFEKEYIETGVELDFTEVDLSNEDDLLIAVTTATGTYVENEELLTDDIVEEVEEKLEEISSVLSEEEALEIGYELFYKGKHPTYENGDSITGAMLVEETNYIEEGLISYDDYYSIAYKFLDASSVEDLYTRECLEDFKSHIIAEFVIDKIDGDWYYLDTAHGGSETLFGEVLTVNEISNDTIEFTLTEYFSVKWFDAMLDGDSDYISSEDYDDETEFIEAVKEKYTDYTTIDSDFIIKLEDGVWKIDVQSVTP